MADLGMSRRGIKSILRIVQTGEAVGTDQAQTFLQLQTFQLGLASNDNIVLDNDKKLQGKSTGGTPLQIARITNADTLSVGESSVITQTNIFAGSVTACISIANSNQITQTKMAQAGVAETLHRWLVSDVSSGQGYLQIENDSATDAQYTPVIEAFQGQTSANSALIIRAYHGSDGAANPPVIVLDSRFTGDVTLATRHLFVIRNNAVDRVLFKADGGIVQTIIDPGANPEFFKATISTNATAYFKLLDADPSSTRFGPWLFAYNDNTSAFPALHVYAQIVTAGDTGTTQPIMVLDSRQSSGAATTRPLLMFRNFGTEYWRSNPGGDILQTAAAQTGVTELLHKWTVSDDASSFIQIENATATDGQFVPRIFMYSARATASDGPLMKIQILSTQDSGAFPCFAIAIQKSTVTQVAVRPILEIRNATQPVLDINAKGDLLTTVIAQTGIAELLHKWTMSDAPDWFEISNNSTVDGQFAPRLRGQFTSAETQAGLYLRSEIANTDSGSTPAMIIDVRKTDSTALATRPMLHINNAGVNLIQVTPQGRLNQFIQSVIGSAEILQKWTISDDVNSLIQWENTTATDSIFQPMLRMRCGSNTGGCYILSDTLAAQDTGTNAMLTLLLRRSDATAITSRSLLDINNAGTSALLISALGKHTQTVTAQAGIGEVLHQWQLTENQVSYIQIANGTGTDGKFSPNIIMRHTGVDNISTCGTITAECDAAFDSGSSSVMTLQSRRAGATNVTGRALFRFLNNNTAVCTINQNGDFANMVMAQTGVAETLQTWQVSDGGSGYIKFMNSLGTDGLFAPAIFTYNDTGTSGSFGFLLRSWIKVADDVGSVPVISIDPRQFDDTSIDVRPLLEVRNANVTRLQIAFDGKITQTILGQAGVAEVLHKWTVSDDANGFIQFENGSTTDAVFRPYIHVFNTGTSQCLFILECLAANDSGTNPMIQFDGKRSTPAAITTRPIFGISNNLTQLFVVNFDGKTTQTITAAASVAEILHQWSVSDDTTSYLKIENASSSDGIFIPYIHTLNNLASSSSTYALQIRAELRNSSDIGTNGVIIIDSRLQNAAAAVVTRPLISIRNNGTDTFLFKPLGFQTEGFGDYKIIATPADPAAGYVRVYPKTLDANNEGLFVKLKIGGVVTEVQIA